MRHLELDTSQEAIDKQREILDAQSSIQRAALLDSLCAGVTELAIAGIRWANPDASDGEIMIQLMVRRYGQDFVSALPDDVIKRIQLSQQS